MMIDLRENNHDRKFNDKHKCNVLKRKLTGFIDRIANQLINKQILCRSVINYRCGQNEIRTKKWCSRRSLDIDVVRRQLK